MMRHPGTAGMGVSLLLGAMSLAALLLATVLLASCGDQGEGRPAAESRHDAPAVAAAPQLRLPGEFEPQDALLISAAQMIQFHPQTLVDIVAAAHDRIRVLCLVGFAEEKQTVADRLIANDLPGSVTFVNLPVSSMWIRDYGPICVLSRPDSLHFVDASYQAPEYDEHDAEVPAHLARLLAVELRRAPLTMEGGDLISNGQGFGLGTTRLLQRNQEQRGYDLDTLSALLAEYFGLRDWLPVPPLRGEPTGHLDIFLTFVDPHTLVLGRYDPQHDAENAQRLDQIATALKQITLPDGAALRIMRIPMPPRPDGIWRTYTNVVFANGRLLVPIYPDFSPALDRQALELYGRLLPEWEIVGIDSGSLIRREGALHCVTMNLPRVQRP